MLFPEDADGESTGLYGTDLPPLIQRYYDAVPATERLRLRAQAERLTTHREGPVPADYRSFGWAAIHCLDAADLADPAHAVALVAQGPRRHRPHEGRRRARPAGGGRSN